MSKYNKKIAVTVIASSVLLSGCGLFDAEKAAKEIDPPQDVTIQEDGTQMEGEGAVEDVKGEEAETTVTSQLFLLDKNGFVVPYTMNLPKTDSVAKQSLEYLVEGGPISNVLPNGFKAVLPQDTEVLGVNIKEDGTAVADFSKEFNNYKKEDEAKILQAITWTLTQFESVKKVKIWVNGHEQTEMPVNSTPIQDGVSRENGINHDSSDVVDITDTHPLTVYYLAETDGQQYYVPVTKRISNEETDPIVSAVNELVKGPSPSLGLMSDFQDEVTLLSAPQYADGKVTLDFNESIYGSFDEENKVISSQVLHSLVLTLTEQPGVESVAVTVNGQADLLNENGEKLTEPVTRPSKVNTGSF
ncbi:GerMN domain-containing protein [Bacillus weihaiensis]|uniref:Sporulation protein n=1 Tax=Bacillus weihaiensis TaxID=1547283 RepID=A0A1L3MPF3_9BACI|nr:GerMN domain-containing protein [Bacillus weihaiensis]APH04182.1 sporulation protein [Bacillus weihaiensis]